MSIAQDNRVRELERLVAEQRAQLTDIAQRLLKIEQQRQTLRVPKTNG